MQAISKKLQRASAEVQLPCNELELGAVSSSVYKGMELAAQDENNHLHFDCSRNPPEKTVAAGRASIQGCYNCSRL